MPFIEHNGKRLLFIHVPKTGGGALEEWMESIGTLHFHTVGIPNALRCTPQHLRMSDFRNLFGDSFFTNAVMVVRNPYDRIESEYLMRAHLAGGGFWKRSPSFSQWLEQVLEATSKNMYHLDNHIRPQWHFHGSKTEVFKFEQGLLPVAARMAEYLDVERPEALPIVHKVERPDLKVTWDDVDRNRVAEFFAKDFDLFGYER